MRNIRNQHVSAMLGTVIALSLLAGCAADIGRAGISNAALTGNTEAMWKDGQRAVDSGEALVSKGEKRLAEGQKKVRDGEAMISQGNSNVMQSRQDYQAAAAISGSSSNPKEIEFEAKRLRAVGDRWKNAIEEIKDGNRLVLKGNEEISKAQSEIREGRALLESGSTLMRNAQRARLGDKPLPQAQADK